MTGDNAADDIDLSRRTFMKGAGAVAGAGMLGAGTAGTAAARSEIDSWFLNWRQIEARKVWDRGFRGRPDRTLALTDTGISARHPDIGPWNDVLVGIEDGEFRLADTGDAEFPPPGADVEITTLATLEGSGTIGPGATDAGVVMRDVIVEFVPAEEHDTDLTANQVDATLTWTPQNQDNELVLDRFDEGTQEWVEVARSTDFNPLTGEGENLTHEIDPATRYRLVIETYANAAAQYDLEADINNRDVPVDPEFDFVAPSEIDPFAFLEEDTDGPLPKTVGWYDGGARFGNHDRPRDPNGHGSHVSGIMAGSGRASTLEYDNTEVHEPRAILLPTDVIEYEVDVHATSTVFASAFGDNIKLQIVHDREVVHESPIREDSIIADEPAVHDTGTATYTIRVLPRETNPVLPAAQQAQEGTPTAGRLNRIAVGSYKPPGTTTGARTAGGPQAVHPGLAPDASLVGLQGFGAPTTDLATHVGAFAETFNIRAVNMSWGYVAGLPLGAAGGELDSLPSVLKNIAEGGILTVAAAGNFMTPANGNGAPAGMDEPISVAATGPFDGLTPYSAGGIGTVDEDETDVDRKPDVTAPGGDLEDGLVLNVRALTGVPDPYPIPSRFEFVRSVRAADPDVAYAADDPPRDYVSFPGTSMASPYVCGVSGLVAQAMEEAAPDAIALPTPAELASMPDEEAFQWTMRLKQAILATASETALTAAPYHAAKVPPSVPVYTHGGRDPYEGFGRVNPDAAVDAVSRNLVGDGPEDHPELGGDTRTATVEESVGLYVPEHSRAVAGYVHAPGGDLDVSVEFTRYSGGNKGMAKEAPHLDLFVYDGASPAANGEPNIVASAQGRQGSASVSVGVDRGSRDDPTERTFYVVAKLVNVPGVVNGFDVRAHFDLDVSFDPADAFPPEEIDLTASGSRSDDAVAFTGGQTDHVTVTLDDFNGDAARSVRVFDEFPAEWTFQGDWSDGGVDEERSDDSRTVVDFGTVSRDAVGPDSSATFDYFVEAPSGASRTGTYTFGPASVEIEEAAETGPDETIGSDRATFGGTDSNVVVGVEQNDPVGSTTEGGSSATGSATDGLTDTAEDTL